MAGLAVRLVYVATLAGRHNLPVTNGDRYYFVEGAKLLASGHGFIEPFLFDRLHISGATAVHPPLWLLVLAPLAKAGGLTYGSARVVSAVLGAAVVPVIGALGQRLAGDRAGLLAAGIAAAYPAWIVADGAGMSEPLYLLLVALCVLALLAARESGRLRTALLAGAAAGLAALTRTEALLLVPLIMWPALWRHGARVVLAATVAAAVVIAPWIVRDAVALHRLVPISTNGDTVLAGANCPPAYHGRNMGSWVPDCLGPPIRDLSPSPYREADFARRWRSAGLHYAGDHLGRLPAVAAVRVLRIWRLWQPLREGQLSEGENDDMAKVGALSFLLLLLPAGLIGAWRWRLRRDHRRILVGLIAWVTVAGALGWGAPRFLRPAELALVLFAAVWLTRNPRGRPAW